MTTTDSHLRAAFAEAERRGGGSRRASDHERAADPIILVLGSDTVTDDRRV
jgi:hypothetical protein